MYIYTPWSWKKYTATPTYPYSELHSNPWHMCREDPDHAHRTPYCPIFLSETNYLWIRLESKLESARHFLACLSFRKLLFELTTGNEFRLLLHQQEAVDGEKLFFEFCKKSTMSSLSCSDEWWRLNMSSASWRKYETNYALDWSEVMSEIPCKEIRTWDCLNESRSRYRDLSLSEWFNDTSSTA